MRLFEALFLLQKAHVKSSFAHLHLQCISIIILLPAKFTTMYVVNFLVSASVWRIANAASATVGRSRPIRRPIRRVYPFGFIKSERAGCSKFLLSLKRYIPLYPEAKSIGQVQGLVAELEIGELCRQFV